MKILNSLQWLSLLLKECYKQRKRRLNTSQVKDLSVQRMFWSLLITLIRLGTHSLSWKIPISSILILTLNMTTTSSFMSKVKRIIWWLRFTTWASWWKTNVTFITKTKWKIYKHLSLMITLGLRNLSTSQCKDPVQVK